MRAVFFKSLVMVLLTHWGATTTVVAQVPGSLPSASPSKGTPVTPPRSPALGPPVMPYPVGSSPLPPTTLSNPSPPTTLPASPTLPAASASPTSSLGPMPVITPAPGAGKPEKWQTPDREDHPLFRPAAYTLAPGDRINVSISTVPEFSGVYQLMVDGHITLPVIGSVDVQNMTETQAAQEIAQRYTEAQVLVKPTITVILSEMSNVHVAIIGEIVRPGAYIITPDNGELPTLTQVIDKAGGITQQADLQAIEIHRPRRDGAFKVVKSSLWSLLTQGDLSQDIAIRDGDTVVLTAAANIPVEVALKTSQANVTPAQIQVNIMGEVTSPGVQTISTGTALNQALWSAGGFTNRAKKKSVELVRLNSNGTISRRKIDLKPDQPVGDHNPILQNRDVILVDRSSSAKLTDTIGNILNPINSVFSLFNVFRPFFPTSK
jgi:polysaccharide biosynthesis/export protein